MATLDDICFQWIFRRLKLLGEKMDKREHGYESSWYGPLNKMTNLIFHGPVLMVKPQSTIRETVEHAGSGSEDEFNDEGTSVDSMGAPVIRGGFLQPDFLIAIVPEDGNLYGDELVCCIEVKKDREGKRCTEVQMRKYLEWLSKKKPHDATRGILILGSITYVYNIQGKRMPSKKGEGVSTSDSDGLRKELEKIAKNVGVN